MNHFYIYGMTYKDGKRVGSATVIFCPSIVIDINQLQEELKHFYGSNFQSDKTIVIGGSYIKDQGKAIILEKRKVFKYVPKIEEITFFDNLHILSFDIKGQIEEVQDDELKPFINLKEFNKSFITQGLTKIFIDRGGLVESTGSHHHYAFPSGRKHSDKFLRVANVLLYSSEIYFIAFSLLKHFDHEVYNEFFCDTSSINSIAISLNELVNRFLGEKRVIFPINSFKSYQGLYSGKINLKSTSFILVSASTSGNILEYILAKNEELRKTNIVILYYLDNSKHSKIVFEQVACNLTKDERYNPCGLERFKTYNNSSECPLCSKGSYPVEVSGDVFLLESPKVNSIRIDAIDMDVQTTSSFVNQFMSLKGGSSVIKVNYKESNNDNSRKYEIYIDYAFIIENIKNARFKKHKEKLDAYIDQYVPSNLKYILFLNDHASEMLAKYIFEKIAVNYRDEQVPQLKSQDQFEEIEKEKIGSILIVGSCITNGKNFLYLSRALRNYKLRIAYFIGIIRPENETTYKFLRTNLKYGKYGPENSSFIEIDKIFCSSLSVNNPWQIELDFLKKHLYNLDNKRIINFFKERIASIEDCYSNHVKGMNSNLFLPKIEKGKGYTALKIRRNSAFFNNDEYANHVSQADVYFTISYVLNRLRNSDNNNHTLRQSTFVKNLLAPENLNRFNDGIIQACILRSATKEELNYASDEELSKQLKNILITVFKYRMQEQGEALLEFLYAIAIQKLVLKKHHLQQLIMVIDDDPHYLVNFFVDLIKLNCLDQKDAKIFIDGNQF